MKARILQIFWVGFLLVIGFLLGFACLILLPVGYDGLVEQFIIGSLLFGGVSSVLILGLIREIDWLIAWVHDPRIYGFESEALRFFLKLPIVLEERKQEKLKIKKREMEDLDRILKEEGVIK